MYGSDRNQHCRVWVLGCKLHIFFFFFGGGGRHLGLEMMSTSELGVEPCICNF